MAVHINLLPYRETLRRAALRQLGILCGLFGTLALATALLVHAVLAGYLAVQEERNQFIKGENARLDKEIAEIQRLKEEIQALLARKQIIENLQADRGAATQLFDQMVRLAPPGLHLKSLKQSGQRITVTGYALSSDLVSAFMRSVSASPVLANPELVEIKSAVVNRRELAEFHLFFDMRGTQPDGADEARPEANAKQPPKAPPAAREAK